MWLPGMFIARILDASLLYRIQIFLFQLALGVGNYSLMTNFISKMTAKKGDISPTNSRVQQSSKCLLFCFGVTTEVRLYGCNETFTLFFHEC